MSADICVPAAGMLEVGARDAAKVERWIAECGGVAVWGCLDMADPGRQFLTPVHLTDGSPARPPHWSASDRPERVVTGVSQVEVVERREARRLRIAVRRGAYGLRLKLTDASSARLRRALECAGEGSTYAFEGNEAVVYAVERRMPLAEWLAAHPEARAV